MTDDEIRTFEQQGYIDFPVEGNDVRIERGEIEIVAEDVEGWLVSSEGGVTVALPVDRNNSIKLYASGGTSTKCRRGFLVVVCSIAHSKLPIGRRQYSL